MFKIDDKVIYNNQHTGKILQTNHPVKDDGGKLGYLVEWDDQNLVPPQMAVPGRLLKLDHNQPLSLSEISEDPWYNTSLHDIETACPICHTEWIKTPCVGGNWYDCPKCNARKEDLID